MPQLTMIRANHLRAPNRASKALDGVSHTIYDRNRTPAPKPNTEAEKPRSLFMSRAAKLTLTRSRKLKK